MKKYLIQGTLALVATMMLMGCHDEEMYSGSTLEQKAKAYEETFVESFGRPNSHHNWGFGTVGNARTRTVLKPDDWDDNPDDSTLVAIIKNAPDPITQAEREYVAEWFANPAHYGFTEGLNISNFYLQHVTALPSNRTGRQVNEQGKESPLNESAYLDELHVGAVPTKAGTEHVKDFNSLHSGSYETRYIQDGSALQFGVHSTFGTDESSPSKDGYYWYFRCENITVPGRCFDDGKDRDGWYVGICFYARANETDVKYRELGNQELAQKRCDAWILKVVPGVSETVTPPGGGSQSDKPKVTVIDKVYTETVITETQRSGYETEQLLEQGRVFCEDLGSEGRTDIDFNDLVFDAKIWAKTKYEKTFRTTTTKKGDELISTTSDSTIVNSITHQDSILVLAAGGTLPLTIANREVNGLFDGIPNYLTMVNTVTSADTARLIKGVSFDTAAPALLVETGYKAINEIPLWVEFANETKKLNYVGSQTETGYIPRCILVPLGTEWATERTSIDSAYAYFTDYVKDMTNCWDQAKPAKTYPSIGGLTASPETAFSVRKFNEFTDPVERDVQEGGEDYVTHEIEVDQVVPEPYGDPLTVSSYGALTQYYGTTRRGRNDAYRISPSQFNQMQPGDIIRVYGIGANSDGYMWRLYTGTSDDYLTGGDAVEKASYNDSEGRSFLASHGYIEIEINDVATLKSTGWYLAGTNFDLIAVTLVHKGDTGEQEQQQEQEQGGSGESQGKQIWPETGTTSATSISLNGNLLGDATVMRIYGTFEERADNWYQAGFRFGNWGEITGVTGWPEQADKKWAYGNAEARKDGYLELPLENIRDNAKNTTLEFTFQSFTASHITIE